MIRRRNWRRALWCILGVVGIIAWVSQLSRKDQNISYGSDVAPAANHHLPIVELKELFKIAD